MHYKPHTLLKQFVCAFKKEFARIILELNQTVNFLDFKMAQIQIEIQKEITNNPQLF